MGTGTFLHAANATLDSTSQMIITTESFRACTRITAGNNFAVEFPGTRSLRRSSSPSTNDSTVGPNASITILDTVP